MIQSFADAATEHLFHGKDTKSARRFDKAVWPVIRRRLDRVDAAVTVADLRLPPGLRLEVLKGDQKGRFSIRVNDQFRITFAFEGGHAQQVRCEDYH